MHALKCTGCGSPDLEFLPGNFCRCRSCGTSFSELTGQAQPLKQYTPGPQNYTPPATAQVPPSKTGQRLLIALFALFVSFLIVVAISMNMPSYSSDDFYSSPSRRPGAQGAANAPRVYDDPRVNAEQPVIVEAPKEPETKAEFRDVGKQPFSDGCMFIGRFFNTGETVLERGQVTLSLFDESGKRLLEDSGYMTIDWLEPGQFTLLQIWVPKIPAYARQEFRVQGTAASSYATKPLPIAIIEYSAQKGRFSGDEIVGTVQNTNKVTVEFIRITIYGYDEKGAPSCVAYGYATEKELAPGTRSGFSVSSGGITVGKPTRYQVIATARAK